MFLKNFWPAFAWAIFVFVLSAIPGNVFPRVVNFLDWLQPDKLVHIFFYGLLSFLLLYGFARQYDWRKSRYTLLIITFLIGTVFGLILEVLQYYVFIGRSGNVYDFIANVLGTLIGMSIFWLLLRKKLIQKMID